MAKQRQRDYECNLRRTSVVLAGRSSFAFARQAATVSSHAADKGGRPETSSFARRTTSGRPSQFTTVVQLASK